jgi:hypothetical protein
MPYIGETVFESKTAPFAKARVVTPENARFAFNPVNKPYDDTIYSPNASAGKNTKYAGYNIDDTAGKDVLVRLANAQGLAKRTSQMPRNAILSIDFTDNRYSDATDSRGNYNGIEGSKVVGRGTNEIRYWPNKWNSARIYTRNVDGDKIDANLMFGPYMRVHTGAVLDYRGWGHYRNNHKGGLNEYWEYCSKVLRPSYLNGTYYEDVENNTGIPLMSVEWGDNMGIYILDDTDKSVRFLQGVNLMNSVIYSMRDTIIGGGIVWKNDGGDYFEDINNNDSGFLDYPYQFTLYPTFTCSQNQVISDTDIVLLAPEGKTRNSVIRHPDSWKNFEGRKLTISGGDIYVGARQTLTIQSEVQDGLAVTGLVNPAGNAMVGSWADNADTRNYCNYTENGNTMDIAPDRIIVDTGGTLTIMGNRNYRTNVNTDIYVKGTLNLQDGAKIYGNIYVYGGGHLNVQGSYVISSADGEQGGIFLYGDETFGTDGVSAGAGTVTLPASVPNLTSGKIHLLNPNLSGQIDTGFLCNDRHPHTGLCKAFHEPGAGQPTGWTVQYSGS